MQVPNQYICLFFFMLFIHTSLPAQIEGLWEVEKVNVGKEEMTPAAKWFDFKEED